MEARGITHTAMARMVKCVKLGQELPGVAYRPFDNDLGKRIFDSVSQEAWRQWIEHSKRIVNEYRLDLTSSRGTQILFEEAERFFFTAEGGTQAPPDYKPE
jgi:Fe-S cluster biosynthesis and repair protein YggX